MCQGADLNVQSADGQMCLHEAIKLGYNTGRHVEESDTLRKISDEFYNGNLSPEKALVCYLLDNGAKPDVADKSGKLPIHYAKDEVVEQMILSRIKSREEVHYYQESLNTERPNESKVSAEAVSEDSITPQGDPNLADKREQSEQNESQTKTTEREDHVDDEEEDLIQLEKHGITVGISKYEIYSAKDITVEVIEEVPPELKLKETEAIISVGLKMSPSDAIFDSPVIVTMPHCGAFTKPKDAEVYIYHRKNDSAQFTAIHSTATSSPRCVLRDRDLDLYLNHFSQFRIVATLRRAFIGKRVICTPIIPIPAPRNRMPILWVNVRDQNVAGQIQRGYEAPIPGEQFLVRWKSGGLKVTCKESTLKDEAKILQEREFRHLTEHNVSFEVDTQNITENEFNLHITLEQSTTKTLLVPMSLNAKVKSEGGACSLSTIPTSSPSAAIHLAETADSASTSKTIVRREERNNFDDILREIAKDIHKNIEIDDLGCKLDFRPSEIQRYIQANTNADYMGTLNMLRDWRKGTTESNEREELRKALIDAKLTHLADKLLRDDTQGQERSQPPSSKEKGTDGKFTSSSEKVERKEL